MAVELPRHPLTIRILEFYTKSKPKRMPVFRKVAVHDENGRQYFDDIPTGERRDTGEVITEDWVKFGPVGALDKSVNECRVNDFKKVVKKPHGGEYHPAAEEQWHIAQTILAAHAEWQKGNELPTDGTPLAAWNALTREEVADLKKHGIASVEQIAEMSDGLLSKITNIPRLRDKRIMAQRFLAASNQNKIAAERAADLQRLTDLEEQNRELREAVASLTAQQQKRPTLTTNRKPAEAQ